MRFAPVVSAIFFATTAFAASESEIAHVSKFVAKENHAIPSETIAELTLIDAELTPSPQVRGASIEATRYSPFCNERTIVIQYQVGDEAPASFRATLVTPNFSFGKVPAVVVLPTLAGPSILEQTIGSSLCWNGTIAIMPNETLLDLPKKLPDYTSYDRNTRVETIRARRMIDVLTAHASVDASRIGVIGFSRGAIAGSILIGVEPRVRAAFLGAGGVGVGHIIARSETERGAADNALQMKAAGIDNDKFEDELVRAVRYDGLLFAHRFDSTRLKIMIVKDDKAVDSANQEMLRRAFGEPETIYRTNGHVGSILDIAFKERGREYLEFFKRRL